MFCQYKEAVPFLFPIKSSKKIPEMLLTVLIVTLFWIVLLYFPFPRLLGFGFRQVIQIELSPFVWGIAIVTWITPFLVAALVYLKKRKN
jgi:hypothetical protein